MRKYEAVFIFKPNEEEENRNQLLDRFKGIVEENGDNLEIDEWGRRRLAYPINDFTDGYYVLFNFEGTPEVVAELDRVVKISDSIIRHMFIREDE